MVEEHFVVIIHIVMNKSKEVEEDHKLLRNLAQFVGLIIIMMSILSLIDYLLPVGIFKSATLNKVYPILYSMLWGIVMGLLIMYGSDKIGKPVKKLLKFFINHDKGAIADSITETIIVVISLALERQFKNIFEKLGNDKLSSTLFEKLIGFIIGRSIIIGYNIMINQK